MPDYNKTIIPRQSSSKFARECLMMEGVPVRRIGRKTTYPLRDFLHEEIAQEPLMKLLGIYNSIIPELDPIEVQYPSLLSEHLTYAARPDASPRKIAVQFATAPALTAHNALAGRLCWYWWVVRYDEKSGMMTDTFLEWFYKDTVK